MTAKEVLIFVNKHGVVLMSGHGPVPNLAEAVAGEPIRGSWWAHPKSQAIYRAGKQVSDSGDVLVCRLVDGKITLVHKRLWPALVRLVDRLPKGWLVAVREEHTSQGRHKVTEIPLQEWIPEEVVRTAARLSEKEAVGALGEDLVKHVTMKRRRAN